jgi:hypothetical protein
VTIKNTGGRTSKYQNEECKDEGEPGSTGPVKVHSATDVYSSGGVGVFFVPSGRQFHHLLQTRPLYLFMLLGWT